MGKFRSREPMTEIEKELGDIEYPDFLDETLNLSWRRGKRISTNDSALTDLVIEQLGRTVSLIFEDKEE